MKRIDEQTYYEILEVSPDATVKEIQRAYEHARETFQADSPAVYSLFLEEERLELQKVIEEAYRVLMDESLRKNYNQSHSSLIEKSSKEKQTTLPLKSPEKKESLSFTDLSVDLGEVTYRGKALKQIRERLGIDLKTIAAETKINMKTLEWIEEEDVEHLPAMVYLKGFLRAYARALNLDPQRLIEGYLELFKEKEKR